MRVFFSAGEASGDAYGAEILSLLPSVEAEAVGGTRLQEAGARLVADSRKWGAIGVVQSLKVVPRVAFGYLKAVQALKSGTPGLLIPIDFGFMNIRLAARAKASGWKVLYFIPPGSWRKDRQGKNMPQVSDEIVTPFPWSAEILNKMGASAHYFGHPLVDMTSRTPDAVRRTGVAVLPGSRLHEVKYNLAVAAEALRARGVTPTIGVAKNLDVRDVETLWNRFGGPEARFVRDLYPVLKGSQAAIVCSGTATLEAALCGCPTVVIYRGSTMMRIELAVLRPKFDHIALPNILLGDRVLPELIDQEASGPRIWEELEPLLTPGPARLRQLEAFSRLKEMTGEPGCLAKTADLAAKMLGLSHP